jgi:hypothetical protein
MIQFNAECCCESGMFYERSVRIRDFFVNLDAQVFAVPVCITVESGF